MLTLLEVAQRTRGLPSWLPSYCDATVAGIISDARAAIGVCEDPPQSNRGVEIDAWNRARGADVGSYWCASFATSMWADNGAATAGVGHDPSCDQLMQWCVATGRFSKVAALGAFIFYGVPGDAKHVGIVQRLAPYLTTIEGNAAWGGAFATNGDCVISRRPVEASASILGYGHVAPLVKGGAMQVAA